MTESIEARVDALESNLTGDLHVQATDIKDALQLIHGILLDLTKDRDNAAEFESDLERIDTIARFLYTG
jgi:hypothetical protein